MKVNKLGIFQRAAHASAGELLEQVAALPENKKTSEHIADILKTFKPKDATYLEDLPQVSNDVKERLKILRVLATVAETKDHKDAMHRVLEYRTADVNRDTFSFANGAAQLLASDHIIHATRQSRAETKQILADHYRNSMGFDMDGRSFYVNALAAIGMYHDAAAAYDAARLTSEAEKMLNNERSVAASAGYTFKPERARYIAHRLAAK